jgi:hypothetical protein
MLPWVPTVLGVCALIVLLVITATRFGGDEVAQPVPPAQPFLPAPAPAVTDSPTPAAPSLSARPDRQVTVSASPRPSRTSARTTTPARTTPAAGPVGGRYRVVDSYGDAFIGEVLVTNTSGRDRDWRAELRFPDAVGELITSWVESAPQATLRRSGDSYLWSSGVPVPARGQVALRFHFSRTGSGNLPAVCTVNGAACTGTR